MTEGCFRNEDQDISFRLAVDDFLIECNNNADLAHLALTVWQHHKFKVDPVAQQHVGIHLKWDHDKRTVRLSMDGHVAQALLELECKPSAVAHAPP